MVTTIKNFILAAVAYTIDLLYSIFGVEFSASKVLLALMGLGISALLLIMALMLLVLQMTGGKSKKPAKEEKTETAKAPKEKNPRKVFSFLRKKNTAGKPSRNEGVKGEGFVFLKKKKAAAPPPPVAETLEPLAAIESEMLALKELYNAGHITADVYVSESRTLFEKARKYT